MNIAGLLNNIKPSTDPPKVLEIVLETPKILEYSLPNCTITIKAESRLNTLTTKGRILAQTRILRGETKGDTTKEAITIKDKGGL